MKHFDTIWLTDLDEVVLFFLLHPIGEPFISSFCPSAFGKGPTVCQNKQKLLSFVTLTVPAIYLEQWFCFWRYCGAS